jgi:hypothetical protein
MPPTARLLHAQKRWASLQRKLTKASTPAARLSVACDYAKGVITQIDPDRAEELSRNLIAVITTESRNAFTGGER